MGIQLRAVFLFMIQKYFEGTTIRVVEKDGEPFFIAKDICDVLGFAHAPSAIRDNVDDEEKSTVRTTHGGPERVIINESGLYSLIFRSRKPEAQKFRKWVTSEVIPSIRKTGKYSLPDSEQTIQEKLVMLMSHSKHPVMQEVWCKTESGNDIRLDMVHACSRRLVVFELKKHQLTAEDIYDKIFVSDYHSAVKLYAGKRKVSFWFVADSVPEAASNMLNALSKDGITYSAMSISDFKAWARRMIEKDHPGHGWYYSAKIDDQLVLEAS